MSEVPLATLMRQLAWTPSGEQHAEELREKADKLDATIEAMSDDKETVKRMLGAWARARLLYCHITGEPLV